ncbi:unnamed protein product, partial [Ectocarpus sp. 8 AP-2014]
LRDKAREAVLRMDLSANEAFLLCKSFHEKGWVQVGVGDGEERGGGYADGGPADGAGEELDEDALDYACALLCRPGTTHVHVSRSRTQHLYMAWSALKLAQEQRRSAIKNAQALVERAHREYMAASVPPAVAAAVAELEKQRREGSTEPPPPAYEAFLEGLSEDYPPLSRSILEAFEAELLRIRHESLAAVSRASEGIEANRATLREAGGGAAAKGKRASELSTSPANTRGRNSSGSDVSPSSSKVAEGREGGGVGGADLSPVSMLRTVDGHPGKEEWLKEVSSNIVEVWEGTREALTFLAVDTALSSSLERRVTALEGVRASDQDICQV